MKKIKTGDFRAVCEFQVQQKIQNEDYGYDHVWTTSFIDNGKLDNAGGLIFRRGASQEPSTTHMLTIRYRTDFKRGMRVQIEGINYTVNRVLIDNAGKMKYLTFHLEQEETLI